MKTADLPPEHLNRHAQRRAWFQQKRTTLEHRIAQAEQADQDWPTTRRRCDLFQLQRELDKHNQLEYTT